MMTEREIEATRDFIRALDAEQKNIALTVLLEESDVNPERLKTAVCDTCHWLHMCTDQEALYDHCDICDASELISRFFGRGPDESTAALSRE